MSYKPAQAGFLSTINYLRYQHARNSKQLVGLRFLLPITILTDYSVIEIIETTDVRIGDVISGNLDSFGDKQAIRAALHPIFFGIAIKEILVQFTLDEFHGLFFKILRLMNSPIAHIFHEFFCLCRR